MAGYKKKNNPNKTHYRKGTTPKKGKPYTISEKDLDREVGSEQFHSQFTQANYGDTDRMSGYKGLGYGPIGIDERFMNWGGNDKREENKIKKDLSGTKTNVGTGHAHMSDSPNKFLGKIGGIIKGGGALIQGIKNRDEYGGGLKGAIKGTGDALTSGGLIGKIKDGIQGRNEEINAKLDTIIAAVGGGEDTPNMDTMSTSPGAAPLAMASPAKFKEFMQSTTQSPISNNTGGKNPNFKFGEADRMMAVADPNVDTKGALFMTKPGADDKLVKVTDEGIKAGNVKVTPTVETKGTDQVTGYKKNKAGVKVNLANLPVNLKVGFDQKTKGQKTSYQPTIMIGTKFKIPSGKKQQKPKFT